MSFAIHEAIGDDAVMMSFLSQAARVEPFTGRRWWKATGSDGKGGRGRMGVERERKEMDTNRNGNDKETGEIIIGWIRNEDAGEQER